MTARWALVRVDAWHTLAPLPKGHLAWSLPQNWMVELNSRVVCKSLELRAWEISPQWARVSAALHQLQ